MTDTTLSLEADATRARRERAWTLCLAWVRNAPQMVGWATALAGHRILGRGTTGAHLRFAPLRPGTQSKPVPLEDAALSRDQLEIEVRSGQVEVRNGGRRPLRVNGTPVDTAALRHGDVLEIDQVLVAILVHRPAWPELSWAANFDFGWPDSDGIVGESPAAWDLRARVRWCGQRAAHTLVTGQSGSGKELAARAVHAHSQRNVAPFISRNASTLPESLFDAELFGHARNYPQQGMPARPGLIGEAHRGTLFLDEISEISEASQAHLLRVLDDEGEYHRLGESRARRADVRIVAATNKPLASLRHDLTPRFLLRLSIPPLQERREDVPLLIAHVCRRMVAEDDELRARHGANGPPVTARFVVAMLQHGFTHHVRELAAQMWQALGEGADRVDLTPSLAEGLTTPAAATPAKALPTLEAVDQALEDTQGNRTHAARKLGISRYALLRLLKRRDD